MMRIAALQMQSVSGDVQANLARIERAAVEAAGGGAATFDYAGTLHHGLWRGRRNHRIG